VADKTFFCFWGGLTTIGGNIVEIGYGDARVFTDFGRAYNPANPAGMPDGLIEHIQSLSGPVGVFISHLHLDHMGAIDALPASVPVYMTKGSALLHQALNEPPHHGDIRGVAYKTPVSVGGIDVTFYETDHDVYGAAAIYVQTPDLKLAHSGDIRMHGANPQINEAWCTAMRDAQLDYLLMEGTSFWPPVPEGEESNDNKITQIAESEVPNAVEAILRKHTGIAFVNWYPRNIDRIIGLAQAAQKAGRTLVLEPSAAQIASRIVPDLKYVNDAQGLSPEKLLMQNSYANFASIDGYDNADAVYIHSNGVPLGPFDPAFGEMLTRLEEKGIAFAQVSSSGHAPPADILALIDKIKPKVLMPWHSTTPTQMIPVDPNQQVVIPQLGVDYHAAI